MGVSDHIDQQIKTLLRAAPQPGQRPSDAYLTALAELVGLGSSPLTAAGHYGAPGLENQWAELLDDKGRRRAIVWGVPNGQHVADAYVLAETLRVLPALLAELLALRAGRPVDEIAEAEDEPEESEEASFAGQRSFWGPGL